MGTCVLFLDISKIQQCELQLQVVKGNIALDYPSGQAGRSGPEKSLFGKSKQAFFKNR